MASKLYVGNLPYQATEEELRALFQKAGTVESVKIIVDQYSGRSRGFAFVEMSTREEGARAIEMFNGQPFKDRNLVVNEARPQRDAGPRGWQREGGRRR